MTRERLSDDAFMEQMRGRIRKTILRMMRARGELMAGPERELYLELAVASACVITWHDSRMERGIALSSEDIAAYYRARDKAFEAAKALRIPPYPMPALDHQVN